jgi:hypothetical protein
MVSPFVLAEGLYIDPIGRPRASASLAGTTGSTSK